MIKLIALDIDATLTSRPNDVSPRNLAAIQKAREAGVIVTLATGRPPVSTRHMWKLLDLHGPAIQFGGALTLDIDTERVIDKRTLPPETVREILRFSREMGLPSQIYVGDNIVFFEMTPESQRYVARHDLPWREDSELYDRLFEGIPKVLTFAPLESEEEVLAVFRERFAGMAEVSRSLPGYIEINCIGVTKGSALSRLAKICGVQQADVAALGDNYLDQDMIEWAGDGVCVSNGAESVKAVADIIVPACDDDGVAYYIENYVLNRANRA